MSKNKLWYAFDLDKTLAEYPPKNGESIGKPIPTMVAKLRSYIAKGRDCRIFTARVGPDKTATELTQFKYDLRLWLLRQGLPSLEATVTKDRWMEELWDDKAKQVVPNTGEIIEDSLEMLRRYMKALNK